MKFTNKGNFRPSNPKKYLGNISNITYRSGWELKFMMYLDSHPDVINWSSEEFCIPYRDPVTNRIRRYFPDFWVRFKDKHGKLHEIVYEVKPEFQTKPPVKGNKSRKTMLNEIATWGINNAKWNAARTFCESKGWSFKILTEKELGIK